MKKIAILAVGFAPEQTELTEMASLLISLSEFKKDYHFDFQIFSHSLTVPYRHQNLFPLSELNTQNFDALILPGGVGIGKEFSNFLAHFDLVQNDHSKNEVTHKIQILPAIEKIIIDFFEQSKPIGGICLASLLVGYTLAKYKKNSFTPQITLGLQYERQSQVEKWGIDVIDCPSQDYITDRHCKIVTTPAFMNKKSLSSYKQQNQQALQLENSLEIKNDSPQISPHLFFEVYQGIRGLSKEIIEMA